MVDLLKDLTGQPELVDMIFKESSHMYQRATKLDLETCILKSNRNNMAFESVDEMIELSSAEEPEERDE